MKGVTVSRTEVQLGDTEWFIVATHWPAETGRLQVRRMTAQWASDHRAPVLTLVGMVVRQDGRPGGRRGTHTVMSWRPEGQRVVGQFPDAVVDYLESHGMALH